MKPVIVYGNTTLCKTLYYDAASDENFQIACFTAEQDYLRGRQDLFGLPMLAFEEIEKHYPPQLYDMLVMFTGHNQRGRERESKYIAAKAKGYTLRNYFSRTCEVMPDISWGDNNIVLAQAYVGVSGAIGSNNQIRQQVYLGHDVRMGSHNVLTPGCKIGGDSQISDYCYIGLGSIIISGCIVAEGTFVGAGGVVIKNTEPYTVNVGNPSRIVRHR